MPSAPCRLFRPKESWQDSVLIESHDVRLSGIGPASLTGRPDGGPEAGQGVETGVDFRPAEVPLVGTDGDERAGGVGG